MPSATDRGRNRSEKTVTAAGEAHGKTAQSNGESLYAALFEGLPQGLSLWRLVCDEAGEPCDLEFRAANEAFRQLFGLSDPVGRLVSEIDPQYRAKGLDILDLCSRVARENTSKSQEVYHPRLDRWFELGVTIGPGDYLLAAVADVTDRRQEQAAMQRLRYSLDQMGDYPTWIDSEGRIIEVSESTCRSLEYTRDELLAMTVFDISPSLSPQRWPEAWAEAQELVSFRRESQHRAKSGRLFPVELCVNHMIFDGQEYDCVFCRDITERRKAAESLLLTQLSVDSAADMVHWTDLDGRLIYANQSMVGRLGYSREELLSLHIWDLVHGLSPELFFSRRDQARGGDSMRHDGALRAKDGRLVPTEVSSKWVELNGTMLAVSINRDVSERAEMLHTLRERDEQLRQSQKMEAVGRLAGGIAHDFNNVLTTIIGYSNLLLSSPECPQGSIAEDIAEIKAAAERAGALTKRILTFSRRQALEPTVTSLNTIVLDTERLLARTLGVDVELRTSLSPDLGQVEIDEHQFVQVLLNLAVNARDAMPKGGALTIETANVALDEQFCDTHPEVHPGPYVVLSVTDTGTGMDPEVLAHVFEPFYTTKPPGQGTGLGLATVYGIVAQSGGCTYIQSKLGHGTTFRVYLPRVDTPCDAQKPGPSSTDTEAEGRTVVVVDSDPAFLGLETRILERRGYRVLPYADGERAEKTLADASSRVDVLLTDLVLSGVLQGGQLAALAAKTRPGLPVLFMSTEARDTMEEAGRVDRQAIYLEKPFTAEELTRRVRTCHVEA
jgi:two-component system cell cycle sensor histidine kinase/response regulator CckA